MWSFIYNLSYCLSTPVFFFFNLTGSFLVQEHWGNFTGLWPLAHVSIAGTAPWRTISRILLQGQNESLPWGMYSVWPWKIPWGWLCADLSVLKAWCDVSRKCKNKTIKWRSKPPELGGPYQSPTLQQKQNVPVKFPPPKFYLELFKWRQDCFSCCIFFFLLDLRTE